MSEKINLNVFCKDNTHKYSLSRLWIRNGFKCASNGYLCIRIKTTGEDKCQESNPDTDAIFDRCKEILPETIDIISLGHSDNVCTYCLGTGREHEKCDFCEGDGRHECDCGDEHLCCRCEGNGIIDADSDEKCKRCSGNGKELKAIKISGLSLRGCDVELITSNLKNPKAIAVDRNEDSGGGVVRFEFEGGEGVVVSVDK